MQLVLTSSHISGIELEALVLQVPHGLEPSSKGSAKEDADNCHKAANPISQFTLMSQMEGWVQRLVEDISTRVLFPSQSAFLLENLSVTPASGVWLGPGGFLMPLW